MFDEEGNRSVCHPFSRTGKKGKEGLWSSDRSKKNILVLMLFHSPSYTSHVVRNKKNLTRHTSLSHLEGKTNQPFLFPFFFLFLSLPIDKRFPPSHLMEVFFLLTRTSVIHIFFARRNNSPLFPYTSGGARKKVEKFILPIIDFRRLTLGWNITDEDGKLLRTNGRGYFFWILHDVVHYSRDENT